MKKILLLAIFISSTVFANQKESSSYNIKTDLYVLDNGAQSLVFSASQVLNNDGEDNPTIISREMGSSLSIKDGLVLNSKVIKTQKNDVLDFSGSFSKVTDITNSDDKKWQESNIKKLTFNNSIILDKSETNYESSFKVGNKNYILNLKADKISSYKIEDYVNLNTNSELGKGCKPNGLESKTLEGDYVACIDGVWVKKYLK